MYGQAPVLNPLQLAAKRLSDTSQRLGFTQIVLFVSRVIQIGILIQILFNLLSLPTYITTENLLELISTTFSLLGWMIVLQVIHNIVNVVNYVFFFQLTSALSKMSDSEPRIADISKSASNMLLIGVISKIIANVLPFIFFKATFIAQIVAFLFIATGFYQLSMVFAELQKNNLYPKKESKILFYAALIRAIAEIALLVSFYQPSFIIFRRLLITYLILVSVYSVLLIIGLNNLKNDAKLIKSDQLTPKSPYQSYQTYQPHSVNQQHNPANPPTHKYPPNYIPSQENQKKRIITQEDLQKEKRLDKTQEEKEIGYFCSNCGTRSKVGEKFCKNCGNSLID